MKWEPIAAMAVLVALGLWLVWGPNVMLNTRPGAHLSKFQFAGVKGELEVVDEPSPPSPPGTHSFRLLYRDGAASRTFTDAEFSATFGSAAYDRAIADAGNWVFRALNVTAWAGVVWVVVGLAGQALFFGRMLVQWVVSEREKRSVIPEVFWWLSLFGGVMLFAYFAWRQDLVGVLGQTSGVVIYARNIRLIHKQRRRAARAAGDADPAPPSPTHDPAPEPTPAPPSQPGQD